MAVFNCEFISYCGFHIYAERVDSISVYYEKLKEWLRQISLVSIFRFINEIKKEGYVSMSEFKIRFDAKFPDINPFARFIAIMLFRLTTITAKITKFLRLTNISRFFRSKTTRTDVNPSTPPKKPIALSQVNQKITIADVLHSDIQLAITSKPLHVKYYNYQTDYNSFFRYLEADLKSLKGQKP